MITAAFLTADLAAAEDITLSKQKIVGAPKDSKDVGFNAVHCSI